VNYYSFKIIPVMKAECSASLLQSSVSHDPSEITLIWGSDDQETVMIIINFENSCADPYFCGTSYILFFRIIWWIESSKEQHLFVMEILCNVINAGQFNASLLDKNK